MENTASKNKNRLKWIAISITVAISILLTAIGIYWISDYGIALFILLPFFIGACPTVIYGKATVINRKEAWQLALVTLAIYAFSLLLFAIEGVICIVMAFPIAMIFAWLGSLIALL